MPNFGLLGVVFGMLTGGAVLGAYLHEFTHYVLLRRSTPNVTVEYQYYVVPFTNTLESPTDLNPNWLRVCAIAPVGWLILSMLGLVWFWPPTFVEYMIVFVTLCGGIMVSPGDLFAFLYPQEFIDRVDAGHSFPHMETFTELVGRWKAALLP